MNKRSLRAIVLWDVALVSGPLIIGLILALNGQNLGTIRLALLAFYVGELFLMLVSGWGPEALRLRGKSYASINAPAFHEVYDPPDRTDEDAQMGRGIRDPVAIGPGIAVALLVFSFAIVR